MKLFLFFSSKGYSYLQSSSCYLILQPIITRLSWSPPDLEISRHLSVLYKNFEPQQTLKGIDLYLFKQHNIFELCILFFSLLDSIWRYIFYCWKVFLTLMLGMYLQDELQNWACGFHSWKSILFFQWFFSVFGRLNSYKKTLNI